MTKLETKVAARNKVNALARAYTEKCRLALSPLIGEKVVLASGDKSAKLYKLCDTLNLPISCYVGIGRGYSVVAHFKTSETSDAGIAFYAEATLYLFDITNGVMVANEAYLNHVESPHYRTDFSAEEIRDAREKVKSARAALQAAESALCSFGEYDNH